MLYVNFYRSFHKESINKTRYLYVLSRWLNSTVSIERLVDIMNNTDGSNRSEQKGSEMINSPDYFHIQELLDILGF